MTTWEDLWRTDHGTTTIPAPSNVVQLREEIHPYAQAIREAWLDRLDSLPRPWFKNAAWDTGCFVTARKLVELSNSPWAGYSLDNAHADYLAHAPHDNVWDKREKCWAQALDHSGGQALAEPDPLAPVPEVTTLDDIGADTIEAFWSARPVLEHLHTFARARMCSPWAVLGVTLARVVTAVRPFVVLPPIVGSHASLNLFVALTGPSGAGKGAAESAAEDAITFRDHIETATAGSGEGIGHLFAHREKGEIVRDREAVLFTVPEVDNLVALTSRQGATLLPQLRSAWSGEKLGFSYADPNKRLPIAKHSYRLTLVLGVQPGRAGPLLDDTDGGTPQRFAWLPTTDPAAPDTPPVCPKPWKWDHHKPWFGGAGGLTVLDVPTVARDTVVAARQAGLRDEGDALDGHALLTRLKVAAALALLDQRQSVTDEDWHLAGTVMRVSDATRAGVQRHLRDQAETSNRGRAKAEGQRAVIVAETVEDAAVQRVARLLKRKLAAAPGGLNGSALKHQAASRDRKHCDAAIEHLVRAGQIDAEHIDGQGAAGVHYRLSEGAQ